MTISRFIPWCVLAVLLKASGVTAGPVDTATFFSQVTQCDMRYRVYLPAEYDTKRAQGERFPVVYLLHCAGCTDDYWASPYYADVDAALDRYDLIAVAPYDGMNTYSYSWWLDSPEIPQSRLATFIAEELKPRIDSLYPTLSDRGNTALTGHSMGGFGSFHLLIEHNDKFGIAVPIKAGVDLRYPLRATWPSDFNLMALLGTDTADSVNWQAVNVLRNAHRLAATTQHIRMYNGVYDTWFYDENAELDSILRDAGVAHEYIELQQEHTSLPPELMLATMAYIDSVCARGPDAVRFGQAQPPEKRPGCGEALYDLRGQRQEQLPRPATGVRIDTRTQSILVR
jgi:putative tributyrin esterase